MKITQCKSCGQNIGFIQLESGKWNPVDPYAVHFNECEEFTTLVMEDGTVVRVNPNNRYPQDESWGYVSHFATCSNAAQHRRRGEK